MTDPLHDLTDVTDRLRHAVADARGLTRLIRHSWAGAAGEQLADRIALVARALDRQADHAAKLAREIARELVEAGARDSAPDGAPAGLPLGPQLPGTTGRRVTETRGVTLPLLGDRPEDHTPS